jgi:PEP-CTERM motif
MPISKFLNISVGILILTSSVKATVTFGTQFGTATDTSGNAVSDGTLWALIVDNGDNSFASTFGLDSSLKSFSTIDSNKINSVFGGQSLAIGSMFAGDTVFAVGGFDSQVLTIPGTSSTTITGLDITANGLSANAKFAFFFFPGVTFTTENATYRLGSQIGGINSNIADVPAGTEAMVIPAEGNTGLFGANTPGDLGGSYPATSFQAVDLVPEPSSAFLASLGVLGLLRRRRN